ncbi:MAG: cell division protein ZapA [Pseudomonadota bacterium]
MNQEAVTPVSVTVLDKEFRIACPPQERDALIRAARHLDGKMREIRHTGKVIGNDRVAVMAAINLTHELLELRDEHERLLAQMHARPAPQEALLAHGEPVMTQSVQYEADALHQQMQNLLNDCNPTRTY